MAGGASEAQKAFRARESPSGAGGSSPGGVPAVFIRGLKVLAYAPASNGTRLAAEVGGDSGLCSLFLRFLC
jgi:hypothetical protein